MIFIGKQFFLKVWITYLYIYVPIDSLFPLIFMKFKLTNRFE